MERIAFIGFGEVGQTVSKGLLAGQRVEIRAFDLLFDAGKLKDRAAELGVGVARDHADAVRGADMVFLAVTAGSSMEAALVIHLRLARLSGRVESFSDDLVQ